MFAQMVPSTWRGVPTVLIRTKAVLPRADFIAVRPHWTSCLFGLCMPACTRSLISLDQTYMGLVYCDGTNGTDHTWTGCWNNSTLVIHSPAQDAPLCWCPADDARVFAFSAGPSLANIMALPTDASGTPSCWPGFKSACAVASTSKTSPVITSSAFSSSSVTAGSSTSSTNTTPSLFTNGEAGSTAPTSAPPTSISALGTSTSMSYGGSNSSVIPSTQVADPTANDSGLANGAKIGIGVGVAGGAIVAIALLWLCTAAWRKRRHEQDIRPISDQIRQRSPTGTQASVGKDPFDVTDPRSPTWSGHKSELPAAENQVRSPTPSYEAFSPTRSELEGSPRLGGRGKSVGSGSGVYEMPG